MPEGCPPRPRRRRSLVAAGTAALLAALLGACSAPGADRLLVADAPAAGSQGPSTLPVWAVDPGDELRDDNLVAQGINGLVDIETLVDGAVQVNRLGIEWQGSVLLNYSSPEGERLTWGNPGERPIPMVQAARMQTTLVRRGAFVRTDQGCSLAIRADEVSKVGEGACTISADERWVVSWAGGSQGQTAPLTIHDLRHDTTRTVAGLAVSGVTMARNGPLMLVTVQVDGQAQAVVIDAETGKEVGRTDTYPYMDAGSVTAGPEGFVVLAATSEGSQLLHVDGDAHTEVIDTGPALVPVLHSDQVVYLSYQQDLSNSSLRSWSPGHDPKELLHGYVGAGAVDEDTYLATRETTEGIEFWRPETGTGELRRALTLPRAEGAPNPFNGGTGAQVARMLVKDHTVYLQLADDSGGSLVRIDMEGDGSDAPIANVAGLVLDALDEDGTAVLTQTAERDGSGGHRILVLGPRDDAPTLRARVGRSGRKLIHAGVVYFTDLSDERQVTVRSVRATGSDDKVRELYVNKQVAGATWLQDGGATRSNLITPLLLIQQQAQSGQQQGGAGQGGAGQGGAGQGGAGQP